MRLEMVRALENWNSVTNPFCQIWIQKYERFPIPQLMYFDAMNMKKPLIFLLSSEAVSYINNTCRDSSQQYFIFEFMPRLYLFKSDTQIHVKITFIYFIYLYKYTLTVNPYFEDVKVVVPVITHDIQIMHV